MHWFSLLLFLASSSCLAESSVWEVSKDDKKLYMGGTMHVLSKTDYPLPTEFNQAFNKADEVVFETDLAATKQAAFQQQMMQKMMYLNGGSLKQALSANTYAKLKAFSTSRGIQMQMIDQMKPPMVVLTLTMLELQRMGIASTGVDEHFHQKAVAEGKPVGGLESIQKQLDFLANMGKGKEDQLILSTLQDMKTINSVMRDMKDAWRTGNEAKMIKTAIDPMRKDYPQIYRQLLVERNQNWMPAIEQMLKSPETEFVLVGAAHLVGKDSVLAMLKQRGYTVRRF